MNELSQDPRLKPTPDYGSLGPGSDLQPGRPVAPRSGGWRRLAVIAAGIITGFMVVKADPARATWQEIAKFLSLRGKPEPASPAILSEHETENLDEARPQAQAELLLERAINHYAGASDQIAERVDRWHGKIRMTDRLNSLFATALNSNDLRVRAAAIEVDLAALNIAKDPESLQRLESQAESGDQAQRVWALWTIGLLGNRGVEPERAAQILLGYVHDDNQNVRYWAVEGLSYLGSDEVIAPLLQIFHDDPSPTIRERAACSLAQSGMLNEKQRRTAIPRFLEYAEDSSLDAQSHSWVYQALRDITGQSLPNDPAAWRGWYNNHDGV
jgi:HEAT repeat protein